MGPPGGGGGRPRALQHAWHLPQVEGIVPSLEDPGMTVPSQGGEGLRTEGAGAPGCWHITAGGPLSSPDRPAPFHRAVTEPHGVPALPVPPNSALALRGSGAASASRTGSVATYSLTAVPSAVVSFKRPRRLLEILD